MAQQGQNVIISVTGTQSGGNGEPTVLELVTEGKYYKRADAFYVVYKETEITGMSGTTTTITISTDKITLTRAGVVNSQLIFEQSQKHVSYYDTVNGAFTVGVFTNYLDVNIDDHGGEIMVNYMLEVDNSQAAENDLHMIIREVKASE